MLSKMSDEYEDNQYREIDIIINHTCSVKMLHKFLVALIIFRLWKFRRLAL